MDDTLFFRPNESDIDIVLRKLRKFELELNVEDDESGFLGVHIKQLDGNRIDLTQTGLLKRVLEAMEQHQQRRKHFQLLKLVCQ